MSAPEVFLLFARQDRDLAARFADALVATGLSMTVDVEPFVEFLEWERRFRASAAVVAIVTPSWPDGHVNAEAAEARDAGKLFVLTCGRVQLPPRLAGEPAISLDGWPGGGLPSGCEGLVERLRAGA
jgi:hypothetical protein